MGGAGLFLIVIAFLFLYFVLVRPQKRRQLDQQRMLSDLKVGDEVVTAGGIYGEVTAVDEDGGDLMVRIAPQLEVRVARRAIAGVTPEPDPEEEGAAELGSPEEPEPPAPTPGT